MEWFIIVVLFILAVIAYMLFVKVPTAKAPDAVSPPANPPRDGGQIDEGNSVNKNEGI